MKSIRYYVVLILFGVMCLSVTTTAAQEREPLETDRPDFVESSVTVGKEVFQFETSVALSRTDFSNGDPDEFTTPTLFRYGISELWELRLETMGYVYRDFDGTSDSG